MPPEQTSEVATTREERNVEFTPFGSQDKIKMNVAIVQKLIAVPTKSGKTCSEKEAIKFIMMCQAKRLNPFEGDAYLIGYDSQDGPTFSLITAHQTYLKRAEINPEFDGMKSGIIVQNKDNTITDIEGDFYIEGDQAVVGGWATVFFKNRKIPTTRRVRLKTFQKSFGVWRDNSAGMICKCFDVDTEVLTTRGFEKFANAEGRIMQVTDAGLEATDAIPFVQRYSGPMVCLLSDDLNFAVTPNHDMITDKGKVEAGTMFEKSRSRPVYRIPRSVPSTKPDAPVSDQIIILAAAYLADGSDKPNCSFWVSVSRPEKITRLASLGLHHAKHERNCAGDTAESDTRTITTKANKMVFGYHYTLIDSLVERGKVPCLDGILSLSQRQARLFVDSLVEFDGHAQKDTGVLRFYASRPFVMQAFELASVLAGYSVSNRKVRTSDISTKQNLCVTISDRNEMPVRKWGDQSKNGLVMRENESGKVWCVTVPSGKIVVRRKGFSMVCGNCAEADALRSSFPTMLGGLYMKEELVDIDVKTVITRPQFDGPQTGTGSDTPTPRSKGKKPTVEVVDTTGKDEPKEPTGEQEPNTNTGGEATPGKVLPDLDHPYDELKKFSARDEVTEPQVVAWCKVNKNSHDVLLANAAPKTFMDLRTDTVLHLIKNWADLVPLIKQVKV